MGGLDSHNYVCAEIRAGTGYRVVSVDAVWRQRTGIRRCFKTVSPPPDGRGRLSRNRWRWPETVPAATWLWLWRIMPGGRVDGITGRVLIYPGLGGGMSRGSYLAQANALLLNLAYLLSHEHVHAEGVPVHLITEAGLVHGDLRARASVRCSAESFKRIVPAIKALGQEMWAFE